MTLLENHLEQISLSSAAIAELSFLPPKIFTNALLHSHDITALIRDTEAHERALFTIASPDNSSAKTSRWISVRGLDGDSKPLKSGGGLTRAPRHESAVAALLGGELSGEIGKRGTCDGRERGEVDVDMLLKGAEELCAVYPIPGAPERIVSLRARYEKLNTSIARFESRVSKQTAQLAKMNRPKDDEDEAEDEDDNFDNVDATARQAASQEIQVTPEVLRREEEEIRELEKKKRGLEDRINGMDRDLGGLLR
ncbi:hypothetical protein MMC07_001395 [Pseudocyphellaria aurata]|nr:hypothetical protein [Pseudocyphellaria aurata]